MHRTAALLLALAAPAAIALAADPPSGVDLTLDQIRDSVASTMDPKADPCEDFYRYSCGGWLDATTLPSDQPRWTRSFSILRENNRELVQKILEDAAADPGPAGTERQKIGDFYASCMDEEAIEKAGLAGLEPMLAEIAAIEDGKGAFVEAGRLQSRIVNVLFSMGASPDLKNPTVNLLNLSQGGLGLPDRDYYLSDDPKKKELLDEYGKYVARLFELSGSSAEEAQAAAGRVVAFETELAKLSRPRAEMRNRDQLYHKHERAELVAAYPGLPWQEYFAATGFPDMRTFNVAVPEFFEGLSKLLPATPVGTLREYDRFHVLNVHAPGLTDAFVDANFDFYGRKLSGQAENQARWKRCVAATGGALGEAIGKLYVDKAFPGESKQVALEMIGDIQGAFASNLPRLAWMDDVTRGRALEKAKKVEDKIGYPDEWRDYSKLAVSRSGYLANQIASARFEFDRDTKKVDQPVDRKEWGMSPQTVNAYYNPALNEIAFPAGILQPPFFHKDFPAAMNYGAIGVVIGHELTHGFDDQGRKSDGDGVLHEWWEPEVAARFEKAAQCVDDQFSSFEVEPGVHVNGKLTLGENIADLGGVKQASIAYAAWRERHGAPEPLVPGLTDEQLLYVSFAQAWCTVASPEYLRLQVSNDPHSPAEFRAVGAAMNSPEFRKAFSCEPGDRMVADPTCTVW